MSTHGFARITSCKASALSLAWCLSVLLVVGTGCTSDEAPPFYKVTTEAVDGGRDDPDASIVLHGDAGPDAALDGPFVEGCDGASEKRALFIGNSHTYVNDLPKHVRELACAAGYKLVTEEAAPGGKRFLDHAVDTNTLSKIAEGAWDFVILQDQQQYAGFRLEQVEEESLPAVRTLMDAIAAAHAGAGVGPRRLFYMVWARREGDQYNCDHYPLLCAFESNTVALQQGYELHAERTGSEVAPVALAWAAVRADPDAEVPATTLWQSDGSHAALPGTYLAAAVFAGSMFGVTTARLSYTGGLDADDALYLREVADRTVQAYVADPRVVTRERVSLVCPFGSACSGFADARPTTFTLSRDSCQALTSGSAKVAGLLRTTVDCYDASCTTVPLASFRGVAGDGLADGAYQVMVHVDVDEDGELSQSDLYTCKDAGLMVGSGADLVVSALELR